MEVAPPTKPTCKRYHERMDAESIVQYLVLDLDFPRSMRFCVGRCLESLRGITGGISGRQARTEAERRLGRLESELRYADIHVVFANCHCPAKAVTRDPN